MINRRIRYWLGISQREALLRAEMEAHVDEKAAELRAEGWSETDARAEARRIFGNFGLKQEESREIWISRYWSEFWQDVRYGGRMLAVQPGFTLASVLALVLGIGVNAVLFNVYNALALSPWSIRDAEETAHVLFERKPGNWIGFSWPHFRYLRANTQSLAGIAAYSGTGARITHDDTSWIVDVTTVSENYFDLIGTGFVAGRGFSAKAGDTRDPAPEIVLQYDTWMSRFGGNTAVLGKWLNVSGHRLQVVGITLPGFNGAAVTRTDLWIPAGWLDILNPAAKRLENPNSCCVSVIGRLKPDVSRSSAESELKILSARFLDEVKRPKGGILLADPVFMNQARSRGMFTAFSIMAATSFLILLLACANTANLQMARARARQREIAVRMSLGAGRGRLARQLLAEALLLSSIACAISLSLSPAAAGWMVRTLLGPDENLAISFAVDARVMAFMLLATVVASLLFGLAPVLGAVRDGAAAGLRQGGRVTSGGRTRAVLLAVQVAICTILLSGTALLIRAVDRTRNLDTGFQYDNVLVVSTGLRSSGIDDRRSRDLLQTLMERVQSAPSVGSVAHASAIPYESRFGVAVADPRTGESVSFGFNEVSANFFAILRVPLMSGRTFTTADERSMDKVIVNEAAAQRLWPGESPLGKTIQILPTLMIERKDLMRPLEVIGVVRNFGARGFGTELEPHACLASMGGARSSLLIRHQGGGDLLIAGVPKLARDIDRSFHASATPYSEVIAGAFRSAGTSAGIAGFLGMLSLVLACVGIYGVAAYSVSERTRELGVRMALGARPRGVLAMVVQENLKRVLIGAVIGIAGAIGFGNLLTSMLYGVKPTDPPALLSTVGVLLTTSVLATLLPAVRASRVDPVITLRHE